MALRRVLGKYMILCSNESNTAVPSVVVIFCCNNSSIVVPMLSLLASSLAFYFCSERVLAPGKDDAVGDANVPIVDDLDHQLWRCLASLSASFGKEPKKFYLFSLQSYFSADTHTLAATGRVSNVVPHLLISTDLMAYHC